MNAISEWLDTIWQALKARWQRKAAQDLPESEARTREADAAAAEIARKAVRP